VGGVRSSLPAGRPEQLLARILQAFEPPHGGVAEHVRALSLSLRERGHEVAVAGPLESQIYPELESAGIPCERLPFVGTIVAPGPDRRAGSALRRIVSEGRFDAAHAHGVKAGVLLRATGALARLPVLYTPHCFAFISHEHREDLAHPRLRRTAVVNAERALGLITARLVCVSEFERGFADRLHIVPAARRRTIPNGIALDRPATPDPDLVAWRGDGQLFGSVSVLRWEKGLHNLIEVARMLDGTEADIRLAIVGDGPDAPELTRRIADAGVGDRIRLFPFSGSPDPHLAALDGLLLPSDVFESLPIGVIEGMAHSLPVIASDIGGLPELVQTGVDGILVPPGDPARLAEAVRQLAADPDQAAELGRRGRELVESRFRLERMTDELEREYLDVSAAR
jgi:glycosyltransferase involved in cell wall biosynthesis